MGHPITLELPRPRTAALDRAAADFAAMSKRERALSDEVLGAEEVFFLVKTGTRADVGRWYRRSRVWACALARELVLFACGRNPYAERIPFAELRGSVYNPVTGELALAPAGSARLRNLRMTPLDGYQMLAQIYRDEGALGNGADEMKNERGVAG